MIVEITFPKSWTPEQIFRGRKKLMIFIDNAWTLLHYSETKDLMHCNLCLKAAKLKHCFQKRKDTVYL